jgi:hypothetical protein
VSLLVTSTPAREARSGGSALSNQLDNEFDSESAGEPFKHTKSRCGAACLESRHGRLSHACGLGELALTPLSLLAKSADLAAEFVGESGMFVGLTRTGLCHPTVANVLPSLAVAHASLSSSTVWASTAQRFMASRARWTSARSLIRVFVKDCQNDDSPVGSDPVAEPNRLGIQMKSQLTELALYLPSVWLAEEDALVCQEIKIKAAVAK